MATLICHARNLTQNYWANNSFKNDITKKSIFYLLENTNKLRRRKGWDFGKVN